MEKRARLLRSFGCARAGSKQVRELKLVLMRWQVLFSLPAEVRARGTSQGRRGGWCGGSGERGDSLRIACWRAG